MIFCLPSSPRSSPTPASCRRWYRTSASVSRRVRSTVPGAVYRVRPTVSTSHLSCSPVLLTCPAHLSYTPVLLTCPDLSCSPVLTFPRYLSSSPALGCPHYLSSPVLPCPHLYCSPPHLSSPVLTCPHLSSPVLTCPHLSSPVLTCPHLSSPVLTCPHLSSPVFTCFQLSLPALVTCPLHLSSGNVLQPGAGAQVARIAQFFRYIFTSSVPPTGRMALWHCTQGSVWGVFIQGEIPRFLSIKSLIKIL